MKRALVFSALFALVLGALIHAQQVGPNVNVLSGTAERTGDAFLQRQNEAVVAVSTRNADHLMVAMNDYRTVDIAFDTATEEEGPNGFISRSEDRDGKGRTRVESVRASSPEAWVGLAFSRDRGRTWYTGLLPGYPQDPTTVGQSSPLFGDSAGSDPVLITGQNGRVYLIALTFDRAGISRMSGTRFTDRNNVEGGEPFYFDFTRQIAQGAMSSKGRFADKPSGAAYAGGGATVFSTSGVSKKKKQAVVVPGCERVYTAYTMFDGTEANGNFRSSVYASTTASCGESWSNPIKISGPYSEGGVNYPGTRNQGTATAVDPDTGDVYIAWRTYDPSGFVFVKSVDGGATFSTPRPIATGPFYVFDQPLLMVGAGTNVSTFRANGFPSLLVYDGKLLATWPERVDSATGLPAANGVPRIVMAVGTQTTTGISWNNRSAVDLKDPGNAANTRCEQEIPAGQTTAQTLCRQTGAQLMPFLTARNGQVAIVYYESRHQDPDPSGDTGAPGGLAPGTGYISGMQRQVDVRAALIDPATWTTVSTFQVSRYVIDSHTGRIVEDARPNLDPKLRRKVSYGNYPMYRGGLAPFIGDYLHAIPLRPDGSGPGFRFVFTSNELVTPPLDLDFTKYDKPQQGVLSSCNPGSRNSTIMTAEVGTGLVVGSPGTFKQLVNAANQSLQRAFAVYVENHTNGHRVFRLTFSNVSAGVQASFEQFASVPQVDVEVLASSSIARTVFLSGAVATGSVVVNVTELSEPDHAPTLNQAASLTLNGDATNPFVGGAAGNPNLGNTETHTPQLAAPQLGAPQLGAPQVSAPQLGAPQLGAPQLGAPQLGAPQVSAPQLGATGPADNTITDVTYKVTDVGNTASSYNSLVSLATAPQLAQTGHRFQVLVYRVHRTAAAQGCGVGLAQQDQVIYQTPQLGAPQLGAPNPQAPQLGAPQLGAPQLGAPQLGAPQLAAPQIAAPQLAATSFTVAPADPTPNDHDGTEHEHQANDEVMLTLRIFHPDETEGTVHNSDPAFQAELENGFAVAVQAQAANTGETTPDEAFFDALPPDTSILSGPYANTVSTSATFGLAGTDNLSTPADLTFECSLDAETYSPCPSPATFTDLAPGTYTLWARARDQNGNTDPTPASWSWTIRESAVTITNVKPATAAAGHGQMVTVFSTGAPEGTPTAFVTQNNSVMQGFVFASPSIQNEYYVRLPVEGVTPGSATIRLLFGDNQSSQEFPIAVSATPGAPEARFMYGLVNPPTANDPCGTTFTSVAPITAAYAGDGLAISAYGIDTTNATAVFVQGDSTLEVQQTCAYSSSDYGLAGVFEIPPALAPGQATVQLKTQVNGVSSAVGNALVLTIREPVSFEPGSDAVVGTNPEGITAGDLNGDGNLDVVTANFGSNNISVLFGNGLGSLGAATNYAAAGGPRAVRLGDLDGDGDLDVVVAQLGGNLSVGLNQGNGTFVPLATVTTTGSNNRVALADVNGDNRLDIAVAKNGDTATDNVGILLGNGNGTFQAETLYSAGTYAWDIAIGDTNGDGRLDLVVSNRDSRDVSVLPGNGSGSFNAAISSPALPPSSTANLFDLSLVDLNQDGKLDVAVGTNNALISILIGSGTGTFAAPRTISYAGFARPTTLAPADFTGDGKVDLAVGNFDANTVSVLRATALGYFAGPVDISTGNTATSAVAAGDFDGDGKKDLVFTRKLTAAVGILRNTTPQ